MRITGTFIDEISTDIPHQNWGYKEWDRDFSAMKRIGIKRVIMIRCGLQKWITYPSSCLTQIMGCHTPPLDLIDMFLNLAEKYDLDFYCGTYVAELSWYNNPQWTAAKMLNLEKQVVDEIWERYGGRKAFAGWYLSHEIATKIPAAIELLRGLGLYCKKISGNLPTIISPGMLGRKAWLPDQPEARDIDVDEHDRTWRSIMHDLSGAVDICAFQDGHVEYEELPEVLKINKTIAEANGMTSWTNTESFDRDMPIRFLPIKWEKLRLKLETAAQAGIEEAITFEFSHFMSPWSSYPQARGLYKRYCEYCGISYEGMGIDD